MADVGGGQPARAQAVDHGSGKGLAEAFEGLRGQLFGEQFDQQRFRTHGQAAFASVPVRASIGKPSRSRASW